MPRTSRLPAAQRVDHPSSRVVAGGAAVDLRAVTPRSRQLANEDGFALLEVIVSAALLAVMIVAVYTSFDFANRNSGVDRSRAVAASLASADQERLRAMPVADLSKLADIGAQAQPDKTIGGVTYTTTSQADWVADASQTRTCTSNGAAADYLKIVSVVAAKDQPLKPVTIRSVVTPPVGTFGAGQGSLAVSVVNAANAVVPGVNVTLSGASNQTRTTDSSGCAFFGYMATGGYTAGLSFTGYVDPDGNPAPTKAENIASEAVSTESFKYDLADSVAVTFDTQNVDGSGNLLTTTKATTGTYVRFGQSGMVSSRSFGDGTAKSSITADKLFPFTDPYSVWAGNCDAAKPTTPATILATASGPPSVVVREPTLVFAITNNGTKVASPTVKVTATGGCSGTTTLANTTAGTGRRWDALPFGTYSYCASDGTKYYSGTVTSSNANGTTVTVPDLKTNGTATAC
jgi:Tfp pilus assembly protein PilE